MGDTTPSEPIDYDKLHREMQGSARRYANGGAVMGSPQMPPQAMMGQGPGMAPMGQPPMQPPGMGRPGGMPGGAMGRGPMGNQTGALAAMAQQNGRAPFARGGVTGPGTGRSDDIPAVLSDGEYVIDAETVALLGDGSSKAGAQKLDELRARVRQHKGGALARGKISPDAKPALSYLGGR